jgi:hypothetical protein
LPGIGSHCGATRVTLRQQNNGAVSGGVDRIPSGTVDETHQVIMLAALRIPGSSRRFTTHRKPCNRMPALSTRQRWIRLSLCALTSGVLSSFPARSLAAPPDDGFHLKYGGGIWATSLNGTVGVRNVQSDVDADFGDLFDKLNFALSPSV